MKRHLVAAVTILAASAAFGQPGGKPIRIGINVSLTGPFAESIKPTQWADELWEKQINAKGGLLGRKVEFAFVDNKSNPDQANAIYEKMAQENFDFIFENSGSLLVQRESTLAEQRKRLFLAPNGFARSLYERGYKYLFYTGAALSEDMNIGIKRLYDTIPADRRPKTISYVAVENIAFTAAVKGAKDIFQPLALQAVLDLTYPASLNDATPIISNLKQKGADIVYQAGLVNDTILFARAAAQQELKYKSMVIGLTAGAQPNLIPSLGAKAVEGMIYATGWDASLKTPGNAEFVKEYTAARGVEPIYNAAQAYTRWQIFEQAVNATKSLDNDVLRDHLLKNAFQTVQGTFKFNEKGYMFPDDTVVTQFQGGKRVIVWPRSAATGTFVYPKP